eukprot:scaffold8360_cov67-Skeletonema_dohrnii-CCMP3373.AAC.1
MLDSVLRLRVSWWPLTLTCLLTISPVNFFFKWWIASIRSPSGCIMDFLEVGGMLLSHPGSLVGFMYGVPTQENCPPPPPSQ